MANLTITVGQSSDQRKTQIDTFGGSPTDLWNAYNWNAFKWGEGTNTPIRIITTGWSDTETLSDNFSFNFFVGPNMGSTALTDSLTNLALTDTSGFSHNFKGDATNETNAFNPSWSEGVRSVVSFTQSAKPVDPGWTEA